MIVLILVIRIMSHINLVKTKTKMMKMLDLYPHIHENKAISPGCQL